MKEKFNIFIANIIFIIHCLFLVFLLIGWYFPQIKYEYLLVLSLWISSWLLLGYCPITKYEFSLRRKYNKNINPNNEAIQYYLNKFFKIKISEKAIFTSGLIFLIILTILTLIIK